MDLKNDKSETTYWFDWKVEDDDTTNKLNVILRNYLIIVDGSISEWYDSIVISKKYIKEGGIWNLKRL